jgi:hypothetical protein
MQTEHSEHRLIVEALESRDPSLAVERTIEHMRSRGRELEAYLGISAASLHAQEAQVLGMLQGIRDQAIRKEPA